MLHKDALQLEKYAYLSCCREFISDLNCNRFENRCMFVVLWYMKIHNVAYVMSGLTCIDSLIQAALSWWSHGSNGQLSILTNAKHKESCLTVVTNSYSHKCMIYHFVMAKHGHVVIVCNYYHAVLVNHFSTKTQA